MDVGADYHSCATSGTNSLETRLSLTVLNYALVANKLSLRLLSSRSRAGFSRHALVVTICSAGDPPAFEHRYMIYYTQLGTLASAVE